MKTINEDEESLGRDSVTDEDLKVKMEHVEYLRVANKPLLFGMEDDLQYPGHKHHHIKGIIDDTIKR